MSDYHFKDRTFIIKNYLEKQTFANFLPGLAGKKGIPLWAFYANRGQGISGFGLANKNHPIMEFTPANKAYESVSQIGFRTFIKHDGLVYEPFKIINKFDHEMRIDREKFAISEINEKLNLKIDVTYFGLPNENLGGLVRIVKLTNLGHKEFDIELLDGLAEVLPAGIQNAAFKEISNLLSSWMDVDDLDKDMAFFKLRSSTNDTAVVTDVKDGNFMYASVDDKLVRPVVDRDLVFGEDSSLNHPIHFMSHDLEEITKAPQVTSNKIPCGFIPIKKTLKPGETLRLNVMMGHVASNEYLYEFVNRAKSNAYFDNKSKEARQLIDTLIEDVRSNTNFPVFDEYIKQNYLDNLLRGGYPEKIGNTIYHLYSRRHGDLERDYNFFDIAPEYYSNGAGNFRDVCQNRRMDSFIHRDVEAFNVKHFASLIQLDGHNPLAVQGMTYSIQSDSLKEELVKRHFNDKHDLMIEYLKNAFTPGSLVNFVENNQVNLKTDEQTYLDDIISNSKEHLQSQFGEGYWSDHFTYILDLVESFEAIYPDQMNTLLFKDMSIKTFDSPVSVKPGNDKQVLLEKNKVRRYGSLRHLDEEKIEKLQMNPHATNFAKLGNKDFETNVFVKLLIVVLTRHAGLDPDSIGVEMESGKPGWNDAMNGLPGIFGSGVSETVEMKRIVSFLSKYIAKESIELPEEINELLKALSAFPDYKERVKTRETYRENIRFGLNGNTVLVDADNLSQYLDKLNHHIQEKLEDVLEENNNILPTFVVYDAAEYEELKDGDDFKRGVDNFKLVDVKSFKRRYLPNFLEAPARLLKTNFDKSKLEYMAQAIKKSSIYDHTLKMYKTSGPLDEENYEIGRIRAFTPGWLERESNFLHMTYKYLLGLLKAGLYDTFYEEIKDNLVCFMDPDVYKRSTLENSSFIAPSNNPNPKIHGQGFFARLSGSTVEVINMWAIMMTGGQPFRLLNNQLIFKLEPKLHKSFFKEDKTVTFSFLKDTQVTYINEDLINTYDDCEITHYELINGDDVETIYKSYVDSEFASKVRNGYYKKLNVYIKKLGGEN